MSATDVEREHGRTSSDWRSPLLDWSESAFWIGLSVVVLSLVSALATYPDPHRADADRPARRASSMPCCSSTRC